MNYYMAPFQRMKSIVRTLVSKKKRRYRENGFDLDLTYITPRIIAMGFPSEGAEGVFRNAASEVMAFLTSFHENHFKVFNLCAERAYSPAKLGGNVEWIPFTDHNPAPVDIMLFFCERAGRTGVMICAYLLYTRESSDPVSAMDYYGERRTKNGKGVTIPSQKRYIFYFNEIIQHGPRHTPALQLLQIILNSNVLLKYDAHLRISCNGGNGSYQLSPVLDSESLLFYFWFNTAFVEGDTLYLMSKLDLDKPFKNLEIDAQARLLFFPNLKKY
eukprot:c21193_g1_i5 orf=335-1150(-)